MKERRRNPKATCTSPSVQEEKQEVLNSSLKNLAAGSFVVTAAPSGRFYGIISTRVGSNEIFNVIFPSQPLHEKEKDPRVLVESASRI